MKEVLRPLAVASAMTLAACSGNEVQPDSPPAEVVRQEYAQYYDHANDVDQLIAVVDQSVAKLYGELAGRSKNNPEVDEHLRNALFNVFDQYVGNLFSGNERNFTRAALETIETHGQQKIDSIDLVLEKNKDGFFMDCRSQENMENQVGYYIPLAKMIVVACDYDALSKYDAVTLFHELVHAKQDNQYRQSPDYPSNFIDHQGHLIINNEVEAYALELELVNILADNQLSQYINQGANRAEVSEFLVNKLGRGASQEDNELLGNLSILAGPYFGGTKDEFKTQVAWQYHLAGRRVAERLPSGDILPFEFSETEVFEGL